MEGILSSQPIAMMCTPRQKSLSCLMVDAATSMLISATLFVSAPASPMRSTRASGISTPGIFSFMYLAIFTDFIGMMTARTGCDSFAASMNRRNDSVS